MSDVAASAAHEPAATSTANEPMATRAASGPAATSSASEAAGPVALVEAIDRDGYVRQAWRIDRWPITIGRALDNAVVLSDPHVAAHHATISGSGAPPSRSAGEARGEGATSEPPSPTIAVTANTSRNGVVVGRERIAGGERRVLADPGRDVELQVGRTNLRLRLAGHALAEEEVMTPVVAIDHRWRPTIGLLAVVVAVILANTWIDTDPDLLARAIGGTLVTALAAGAVWCGLWALLSKTFTRQSHFGWHVRVFVVASLVGLALAVVPELFAFAFSWPWLTDFAFIAVYATVAAAIYFHLLAVEPGRQRLMRAVAATGFVVGVALTLWFNVQRTGRPGEELYMNHLFPPSLRIARPAPVDRFVQRLAPMQAILDRQAKEPTGTDSDSRNEDEEE